MAAVAFDASALLLALAPDTKAPLNPDTRKPVELAGKRMRHLLDTLETSKATIIIPTPTFAEILVRVTPEAAAAYLDIFRKNSRIKLASFDARAAIELAEITRALATPSDKRGGLEASWAKIKFDRQILAIARVHQVDRIYTDDTTMSAAAEKLGMTVVRTCDLELPQEELQGSLPF